MKRAAVLHTTPVTIPLLRERIERKCRERGIEAEIFDLLDDSVLPEINRSGAMTPGARFRLSTLLLLAQSAGADAVLCACSSVGEAVEEAGALVQIPVLRIDGPMAERAAGYKTVGVAATLDSTLAPTCGLIRRKAQEAGRSISVSARVAEGAGALLSEGKEREYDERVAALLRELLRENEAAVLAQASMARALSSLTAEEQGRCLTSVDSGAEALVELLGR